MVGRRLLPLALVAVVVLTAGPAFAAPGDTLWTKTYDGPASGIDSPAAMVVDAHNDVLYVVGSSAGDGTHLDIVTIAYNVYSGDKLWARRYDGPAHGDDQGVAIAYNVASQTIIVTGSSETTAGTNSYDAVTISYFPDGSQRWMHRFSVTSSSSDTPVDLVVSEGSSYVLVGGSDHGGLVRYNDDGARAWRRTVTDRKLANLIDLEVMVDDVMVVGSTFITFPGPTEYFVADYSAFIGTSIWTRRYDGPNGEGAYATDAAVGQYGYQLYVTGTATDFSREPITTIAYGFHDGFRFWRRTIKAQAPGNLDQAPHIAVSLSGSSIAVAATSYLNGVPTFLTREYSSDGSVAWTEQENDVGDSGSVSDVAIAPVGTVFVAGAGTISGSALGPVTVAYDQSGGPAIYEAAVTPATASDTAMCLTTAQFGDQVFVGSRWSNDLRVDSYLSH